MGNSNITSLGRSNVGEATVASLTDFRGFLWETRSLKDGGTMTQSVANMVEDILGDDEKG